MGKEKKGGKRGRKRKKGKKEVINIYEWLWKLLRNNTEEKVKGGENQQEKQRISIHDIFEKYLKHTSKVKRLKKTHSRTKINKHFILKTQTS